MLNATANFRLTELSEVATALDEAQSHLSWWRARLIPEARPIGETLYHLVDSLTSLCEWGRALTEGNEDASAKLDAAKAKATLVEDCLSDARHKLFRRRATRTIEAVLEVEQLSDLEEVFARIAEVPVPSYCVAQSQAGQPRQMLEENDEVESVSEPQRPFIIKVMLDVNGSPWSVPQVFQVGQIYDLNARLTVPGWPENAERLEIDYTSTITQDQYNITPLTIDRPSDDSFEEFEKRGSIEFPKAQSLLSEPIDVRLFANFHFPDEDTSPVPATVIGYRELKARVRSRDQEPLLTGYPSLDRRVADIIHEIESIENLSSSHREDFIEALRHVANYQGLAAQGGTYREGNTIQEDDFQRDLLRHLRGLLGREVQEAPKQGGGITDIQYRSVTIELKVEKDISERSKLVEKYSGQPTQYSSSVGSTLGITCILDLAEKEKPPASLENEIQLVEPELHGYSEEQPPNPTKIAVVFINGNLPPPSEHSR